MDRLEKQWSMHNVELIAELEHEGRSSIFYYRPKSDYGVTGLSARS